MQTSVQTTWQVQEAKSRFSELIGLTLTQGPQTITRHGRAVAQIVALTNPTAPTNIGKELFSPSQADGDEMGDSFKRHLLNAPPVDTVLALAQRQNCKVPTDLGS